MYSKVKIILKMEYSFSSQNGKTINVYKGYGYRCVRTLKNGTKSYRCVHKSCSARAHEQNEVVEIKSEHNHVPDPGAYEARKSISAIKERATTSRDTPRFIIQTEQATLSSEAISSLPQYRSIQRTVQRKRKLNSEPIVQPRAIPDINIPDQLRSTLRGENFLLHDSGSDSENRFFIFGSEANLDTLTDNWKWFADGTFKVAPQLFYQLTTIHALVQGTVLPMLYLFLQRKDAATYKEALNAVKTLRPRMNPQSFLCDYEQAFHIAVRDVFGNDVTLVGCLFHFGQCIWRKVQAHGLTESYASNEAVRMACKQLMALAFVPVESVVTAFETVQENAPDDVIPVFNYFEDTWIGRPIIRNRRRPPTFPPEMWSIHQRTIDELPRTNNSVEAWHRAFQGTVGYVHPTVYKLIEAIRLEQSHTENLLVRIHNGQHRPTKNAKYQRKEAALKTLATDFANRNLQDYLRAVSHHCELNV